MRFFSQFCLLEALKLNGHTWIDMENKTSCGLNLEDWKCVVTQRKLLWVKFCHNGKGCVLAERAQMQ